MNQPQSSTTIRPAVREDAQLILDFIHGLAKYENLSDEVIITKEQIQSSLFTAKPYAEVIIAEYAGEPSGFALYFYNFSTFLGKPGIYLEDLFVVEDMRGKGIGGNLLKHLANLCVTNDFGRLEWCVLDWNEPAINVYDGMGASAMKEWIPYRLTGDELVSFAAG